MKKINTFQTTRLSSLNGQEISVRGSKADLSFDDALIGMGITPQKRMPIKKARKKAISCDY